MSLRKTQVSAVRSCLIESTTGSSASRALFDLLKSHNSRISLRWLGEKAGLKSKGHLSEFFREIRAVSGPTAIALAEAFGLEGLELQYFVLLCALQSEDDIQKRKKIADSLATIAKTFLIQVSPEKVILGTNTFEFMVFCAFGLSVGEASVEGLCRDFGEMKQPAVEAALAKLLDAGLVSATESGGFQLINAEVILKSENAPSDEKSAHLPEETKQAIGFVKDALIDANESVQEWYPQRLDAYFQSTIVSVNREFYRQKISTLRNEISKWQSALETTEADTLVRVNLQIYPIVPTRKK